MADLASEARPFFAALLERLKARDRARRVAAAAPATPRSLESLRAELAALPRDLSYQLADNYADYCAGRDRQLRREQLQREIGALELGHG